MNMQTRYDLETHTEAKAAELNKITQYHKAS